MTRRCGECGCEFSAWEEMYSWEEGREYVCEDCFDSLLAELTRREKARLMGCEVLRSDDA